MNRAVAKSSAVQVDRRQISDKLSDLIHRFWVRPPEASFQCPHSMTDCP